MLTFILVIIAFAVSGWLTSSCIDRDSIMIIPSGAGLGLAIIIAFTMSFSFIVTRIDMPGDIAEMKQTYASLVYQMENIDTLYGNSHANDRKALYDEIQEWNETIARGLVKHESLWTNWCYPIDYSQFELIELK